MLCNSKMGGPGSGRIAGGKKTTKTTKTKTKTKTQTQTKPKPKPKPKPVKKVVNRGYKKKGGDLDSMVFGKTKEQLKVQKEQEQAEQTDQINQNTQANYWYDFFNEQIENEGYNKDIKSKIESKIESLEHEMKFDCMRALREISNIYILTIKGYEPIVPNILENPEPLTEIEKKVIKKTVITNNILDRFFKAKFGYEESKGIFDKITTNYNQYCSDMKDENCDEPRFDILKDMKKILRKAEPHLNIAYVKIQQIENLKQLPNYKSETSVTNAEASKPVAPTTVAPTTVAPATVAPTTGGRYKKVTKKKVTK